MTTTPKLPSALFAAALAALLLAASAHAPAARAGSLPEDLLDAADESDNDPADCPPTSLDKLILCIVDDAVNNNSIVRALTTHAGYHYQNVSNARNYTVAQAFNVTTATLEWEWDVERGTVTYAFDTYANALRLEGDARRLANDAWAFIDRTVEGECVFLNGQPCPVAGNVQFDDVGTGIGSAPSNNCPGLIGLVRCHYTNVTLDTANQTVKTANGAYWAAYWFEDRQDNATAKYQSTVSGATWEYAGVLVRVASDTTAYMRGFAARECKLVYSGCPLNSLPALDPATLLPLLG